MMKIKKSARRTRLFTRGWAKELVSGDNCIQNIYHACVQKTGSQWVKAIFSDPEIIEGSGLKVHPQYRYEVGEFKQHFPLYTFVPGLYIPYPLYKQIKKPKRYKTLYIVRDPRDIVVSWYYSMKYTHREMGSVSRHRKKLKKLSQNDGIKYCIRHLQWKFSFVRTWWENKGDPHVHVIKFENLVNKPKEKWNKIFNKLNLNISEQKVKNVLSKYTKEKMRERDNRKGKGDMSHYRKNKKGWKELFTKEHIKMFENINGNIVKDLGYK